MKGRVMLVSTHNLGSVPEFCDRVVMINRTVLAADPPSTMFTQANLERAFGGVLRHFARRNECTRTTTAGASTCSPMTSGRLVFDGTASRPRTQPTSDEADAAVIAGCSNPFAYEYMLNAMWVSALVGGVCAFLSAYLMLKGWSLIGDALSHAIVPGVAGAYMLGLPFSIGAFFSGVLAALGMLFLQPAHAS